MYEAIVAVVFVVGASFFMICYGCFMEKVLDDE